MALALASLELGREEVIVRRLQAAETLGAVTALPSDKTGTFTENCMVLEGILMPDGTQIDVDHPTDTETQELAGFFGQALSAVVRTCQDNLTSYSFATTMWLWQGKWSSCPIDRKPSSTNTNAQTIGSGRVIRPIPTRDASIVVCSAIGCRACNRFSPIPHRVSSLCLERPRPSQA
jgi:magnesium-transporting ATPase (P-type)